MSRFRIKNNYTNLVKWDKLTEKDRVLEILRNSSIPFTATDISLAIINKFSGYKIQESVIKKYLKSELVNSISYDYKSDRFFYSNSEDNIESEITLHNHQSAGYYFSVLLELLELVSDFYDINLLLEFVRSDTFISNFLFYDSRYPFLIQINNVKDLHETFDDNNVSMYFEKYIYFNKKKYLVIKPSVWGLDAGIDLKDIIDLRNHFDINKTSVNLQNCNEKSNQELISVSKLTDLDKIYNAQLKANLPLKTMSIRTFNIIKSAGYSNIDDLLTHLNTFGSFTNLRNCGAKSAKELEKICRPFINHEPLQADKNLKIDTLIPTENIDLLISNLSNIQLETLKSKIEKGNRLEAFFFFYNIFSKKYSKKQIDTSFEKLWSKYLF